MLNEAGKHSHGCCRSLIAWLFTFLLSSGDSLFWIDTKNNWNVPKYYVALVMVSTAQKEKH